jgi:hypothetical protein
MGHRRDTLRAAARRPPAEIERRLFQGNQKEATSRKSKGGDFRDRARRDSEAGPATVTVTGRAEVRRPTVLVTRAGPVRRGTGPRPITAECHGPAAAAAAAAAKRASRYRTKACRERQESRCQYDLSDSE